MLLLLNATSTLSVACQFLKVLLLILNVQNKSMLTQRVTDSEKACITRKAHDPKIEGFRVL